MHEALAASLEHYQEREFRREWRRWVHEDCRFFGRPGSGIFGDEAYPMPFGADRGISTPLRLETAAAERSDYEYIWRNRGGSRIWKRKKVTTVASPAASLASSAASVVTATPDAACAPAPSPAPAPAAAPGPAPAPRRGPSASRRPPSAPPVSRTPWGMRR